MVPLAGQPASDFTLEAVGGGKVALFLDADGTVATASRVTATPTVVLLDRGGRVVGKGGGLAALAGRQGPGPVRRAAGAGALTALAGRAGPHYR